MLKKISLSLLVLVLLIVGLSFTPQFAHLRNFAIWGKHTIHDYKTHPTRLVASGGAPQYWPLDSNFNKGVIADSLLQIMDSNDTHAFLVFQDGKLLYEKYWDGYTPKTLSGSFSAAKSIISLLIGIALDEGKIKSLEEPVGNYVPHFKEAGLEKVRIKDLLTMSSGTNYKESDKSYFSLNAYGYYGDDEEYMVNKMAFKELAGVHWDYRSGDTQVLGLIVEKVFGQNISTLVSERFLKPMGAEEDALWLLDGDKKHEKAFCCFNGVARDYARFGELVLHNGNWKGKQIVSEKYVKEATTPASYLKDPTENENPVDFYGYQYWMVNEQGHNIVFQNGLFGQYVYVIRDKNAVVVRLGESKVTKPIHHHQPEIFTYAAAALSILK
ncbi:MAG: serine hydrolase [Chitinophagaceae bacterium]|jgi:CubicO group peptidase (beta-lactamase class C family)